MRNLRLLYRYSLNSFSLVFSNFFIFLLFLVSKILRLGLFFIFLSFLTRGTGGILGYSQSQIVFFYLSFNLVDTLAQLLFREVYRFRPLVISGGLDYVLSQPVNPLLRVLLGGPDVIDFTMFWLIAAVTVFYASSRLHPDFFHWLYYLLLLLNGLILAAAFHITVLGLGVITTSVDHLVMIYRDLTSMLRLPVDLYIEPIRSLLTFVIPLGIMITFPAKALMGLLTPSLIIVSVLFSLAALGLSLRFWHSSLRHYQSASS